MSYQLPKATYAAAVIMQPHTGCILLLKRGHLAPYAPNTWALPAGKVETGEDVRGAIIRELQEELGLDVNTHPVSIWSHDCKVYSEDKASCAYCAVMLTQRDTDFILNYENVNWGWFRPQELWRLDMIPGQYENLKDFLPIPYEAVGGDFVAKSVLTEGELADTEIVLQKALESGLIDERTYNRGMERVSEFVPFERIVAKGATLEYLIEYVHATTVIEKGRKGNEVGAVETWGDRKFQKQSNGKWKPLRLGNRSSF